MFLPLITCLWIQLSWALIAPVTNPQELTLERLENEIQSLQSQINKVVQKQGAVVSFKANLSKDRQFPTQSTIIFDDVENNIGNGYNPTSGVFHAPIAGIYFISGQVQSNGHGDSDFGIVNQGVIEASETITDLNDGVTMTSVFHMGKGEDLYLKKIYDDGSNAPVRGYRFSHFSGHLLRAD